MGSLESWVPPEWARAVAEATPQVFWFGTLFVMGAALAAFYFTFRFHHRLRTVADTPTSKVRSAPQGYVELVGTGELMAGEPILSPLTGTRCTWYSFRVEERIETYDGRGRRRSYWNTVNSGTSDALFLLRDGTGECVIDPEGAEVTPSRRDRWYGNSALWSGPPRRGWGGGRYRYRYTELRMLPGDPLYAIGEFHTVGGSQEVPDTANELKQLLREWKQQPQTLLARFDADGDGRIDLAEWEQARRTARREVLKAQRERATRPPVNLMHQPEASRRPFLLSVLPQETLVARYRWAVRGAAAGFLLSGAIATWLLSVRVTG